MIAKNSHKKLIGGYSHKPWNLVESFVPDEECKSFLFSLTLKKKYNLKENRKNYAIYSG